LIKNMMNTSFSPTVLSFPLFLSDLAHPEPQAILLSTPCAASVTPVAIPILIEEAEDVTKENLKSLHQPDCFFFPHEDHFRRARVPENLESLLPGLFNHIKNSLRLGMPLQVFSRIHLISTITQTEDPLALLEEIAPFFPSCELASLVTAIQPVFVERMNRLLADEKKRGVIRYLRGARSLSFSELTLDPRSYPKQLTILGMACHGGKSGFYLKSEYINQLGTKNVQPLLSFPPKESTSLCMVYPEALENATSSSVALMGECAASLHLNRRNIPFILKMWGVNYYKIQGKPPIRRIFSEYATQTSLLSEYLRSELSLLKRMRLGLQLAQTLQQMHSQGLFHMNLIPDSILVLKEGEEVSIRLHNFASLRDATIRNQTTASLSLTTYPSPEMIQLPDSEKPIPVTPGPDLFNLGNILFALKFGLFPFQEVHFGFSEKKRRFFMDGVMKVHAIIDIYIPSPQNPLDKAIVDLFSTFPENRPPASAVADILSHWIDEETHKLGSAPPPSQ